MTAASRTAFQFCFGARSLAVAALLAFAAPAAAESTAPAEPAKSAPIADANDKPGADDPLEGIDLHDQPLGPTAKGKKGRKAPPAQQQKPGKAGASKT